MTIGERLRALRTQRGYSQEQVAKMLGVGRTTYLKYESGENKPSRNLDKLASLFGVTTDYLLGRTASPAAPAGKPTKDAASEVFDDEIRTLARAKLKDSSPEQVAERKEQVKKMIEVFW